MTNTRDDPRDVPMKLPCCAHCGKVIVGEAGKSWNHSETGEGRCALYAEPSEEIPCEMY